MTKLLPLLAVLILGITTSCQKPQAFDYRDIKNFKVEGFGATKSRVSMDLVFFNPNSYGVDLKKVDSDIYLNSVLLGKFVLDTTMRIPQASEFTLPASFDVDMKNILTNSLNLFLSKEVLIGAKGSTRVGKGGFYVTIPFTYEGKHKLNLF
ncbi:MAG: type 2 family protein [Segetibacter sp.]|nr:type 2 family protein [Segetibacter sp.]